MYHKKYLQHKFTKAVLFLVTQVRYTNRSGRVSVSGGCVEVNVSYSVLVAYQTGVCTPSFKSVVACTEQLLPSIFRLTLKTSMTYKNHPYPFMVVTVDMLKFQIESPIDVRFEITAFRLRS